MIPRTTSTDSYFAGIGYFWLGLALIRRPHIRTYVIVPLVINITLFTGGLFFFAWGINHILDNLLPEWLWWLRYLLWPFLAAASLIIVFYSFSIVANLIASPFNGLLSEAVEQHLTGETKQVPFSWNTLYSEVFRTIGGELRKLLYFALWALPCLVLFLIPGINIIAVPLWFLFGAWMMAIEYIDCPLGNHGLPFPAVKQQLHAQRKLAFGFGTAVMLMTMIPIVNFLVMPASVAAATALYLDRLAPNLNR